MAGLAWGATTDTGRIRTANEDSVLAVAPVFAVADGMGGHAAGEVASGLAVAAVSRVVPAGSHPTLTGLVGAVQAANQAIYERAGQDVLLRGMGTTLCAIARLEPEADGRPRLAIVNVGDSRVYVLHEHRLSQISRDHSFVEDLVAAGEITPEEARFHPQRNVVTRALGIDRYVEVDTWELTVHPGDRFLLCSDGLSNEVADATIEELMNKGTDPQAVADELVGLANSHGGRDNISVVVVDVLSDEAELGDIVNAPAWATIEEATTVTTRRGGPAAPVSGDPGAFAAPVSSAPSTTGTLDGASMGTAAGAAATTVPNASVIAGTRRTARRRFGLRVRSIVFVAAIAAVFVVALTSVQAYGRAGWYVGFHGDDVALYQGRKEGLLWVKPRLVATLGTSRADLTPVWQQRVTDTISFTSQDAAKKWHGALKVNPAAVPNQPTVPTVPPTTTTVVTTVVTTPTTPPTPTTTGAGTVIGRAP